jgi:acylphosphatase
VLGLHSFKLHRYLVDGTVQSVWFRQVFGLHSFKLHRHVVDGTVKCIWFRQVFGLGRCLVYTGSNYIDS